MILVYSLLTENRERLINQLVQQVRADSRIYSRISRAELKESLTALFDAYVDYMVSKNMAKLSVILGYWVRTRLSQSFHLSAILKAALALGPVLRLFLQDAIRRMPHEQQSTYNQAMKIIEQTNTEVIDRLIEIFEEQSQTPKPQKSFNLSSMMIFRG